MPGSIVNASPSSQDAAVSALGECLAAARRIVAFTGAGISTECGVPDFRSPDSPWLKHPPISFEAFMSGPAMRREAWRRKFTMDDTWMGCTPGRGHRAIRRLDDERRLLSVVTQNIDNLHQLSGIPPERVVELHGNATYATCLECGVRHDLATIRPVFEATGEAPVCSCGGIVKSATISFGQSLPADAMRRARDAVTACDLLIAIGSSLIVQPAARFPLLAKQNGAVLVILNRDPTPLDGVADLVVRGDIGTVMQQVVDNMRGAH